MGIYAIIVIKNKKEEYLQYYDEIWKSYLFLNCKLPNGDDSVAVIDHISKMLDIDKEFINVSSIGKKQHKKFSESAKKEKEYIHYFYDMKLDVKLPDNEFELNNVMYKWFSYSDLMKNERIQKVNSDIVQFIKEFNM